MIIKPSPILAILCSLYLCSSIHAAPWYTGPLLAPAGQTIPLGHANVEVYGFSTSRTTIFDNKGKKIHVPRLTNLQTNPLLSYGLADKVDVQLSVPFTKNHTQGRTGKHIGDTSILLGFQALKQQSGSIRPDLRITLQQIIPTGRFDYLNPTDKGVGATGGGGYQNAINLNFQELTQFSELHYLRTRLSLSYLYGFPHAVHGSSAIGGGVDTHGVDKPNGLVSADLAGEYSLTQNWVGVMELYYMYHQPGSFKGTAGFDDDGNLAIVGTPKIDLLSLAPAIEYNFSANYGIIAGVWFAVQGKNAPVFTSTVIAFNAYW